MYGLLRKRGEMMKCWICRKEIEEIDGVPQALPVRLKKGSWRNKVVWLCIDCYNARSKRLAREKQFIV